LKILQSIIALFIAALTLFSTTGVRISQHWCGDRLINATIWGDAEPCSHAKSNGEVECPVHGIMKVGKKCCSEREVMVEGGDEDYEFSSFLISFPDFQIDLPAAMRIEKQFVVHSTKDHFRNHSPPLIESRIFLEILSLLL